MEKVKLEFETPKKIRIDYNEKTISVNPVISFEEQTFLIEKYLKDYIDSTPEERFITHTNYNYIKAKYNLAYNLIQITTDIDVEGSGEDNVLQLYSLFHNKIKENIINYYDFENTLNYIVSDIKQEIMEEKSVGIIIKNLSEKLFEILEKFSDLTPEKLEELQKKTLEIKEEFGNPIDLAKDYLSPIEKPKRKRTVK